MGQCLNICPGERPDSVVADVPVIDEPQEKEKVKFLLLGAGESGKTTLFKQMKINYVETYKEADLLDEKDRIIKAFLLSFRDLVAAIRGQYGSFGSDELDEQGEKFFPDTKETSNTKINLNEDIASFMSIVWNSDQAKEIWSNRSNFQITDSLAYFCGSLDRLADPSYKPTEEDYLRCRIVSAGIIEQTFEYKGVIIVVVDVGGQRSERKKWVQCFDQVTAVLFVAALSEFDQKLFEDNNVDRLNEAQNLFRKSLGFTVFKSTPFVLFLNKQDLLEEKLKTLEDKGKSLDEYFPELELGHNYKDAKETVQQHLKERFLSVGDTSRVITHFVTATDSGTFKKIFQAAATLVLRDALKTHFQS